MSLSLLIMRGSKKWVKNELIRLAVLSSLGFLLISHRNLAACFVCRDIRLAHRASLQLQRNTVKALYMTSSSSTAVSRPWYSHPDLERDRSHVLGAPNTLSDLLLHDDQDNSGMWAKSRFILMTKRGTWHLTEPHSAPLFLSRPQIKVILGQRNDGVLLEKAVDELKQNNLKLLCNASLQPKVPPANHCESLEMCWRATRRLPSWQPPKVLLNFTNHTRFVASVVEQRHQQRREPVANAAAANGRSTRVLTWLPSCW
jgi:hypothetical protein